MLLTPNGKCAKNMDKVMLLSSWVEQLVREELHKEINIAGIGKPTYPLSLSAVLTMLSYWLKTAFSVIFSKIILTRFLPVPVISVFLKKLSSPAIGYGHPQGERFAREKMSCLLSKWYAQKVQITADDILFTVGGSTALHITFNVLNRRFPQGKIITAFPYYPLHKGNYGQNHLFEVPVMSASGYKINARLVKETIDRAYKLGEIDGQYPSAFLLCDPSNPLGTALREEDLQDIADVLRAYPDLMIILDEAYAEMRLDYKRLSLFSIAPDLRYRIILIRSATKALSLAGERMALIVACDAEWMSELTTEHVNICGHAPKSLQMLFINAMSQLTIKRQRKLMNFYAPKILYVEERVKQLGIRLPDATYHSSGTFYVVVDLSVLIGTPLNLLALRAISQEQKEGEILLIKTDEEIVYHLLFTYGLMLAPLSYFGLDQRLGYVRITCSAEQDELERIMNKIQQALNLSKRYKQERVNSDNFVSVSSSAILP